MKNLFNAIITALTVKSTVDTASRRDAELNAKAEALRASMGEARWAELVAENRATSESRTSDDRTN